MYDSSQILGEKGDMLIQHSQLRLIDLHYCNILLEAGLILTELANFLVLILKFEF